jgi:hypothetical protein
MRLHKKTFDTEAEAQSFIEGVELVNDSDLSCHEPRLVGKEYVVYVHDWSYESATDLCPVCGAGEDYASETQE